MSTIGLPLEKWEGWAPPSDEERQSGTRLRVDPWLRTYDPWDEYTPAGWEATQPSMRMVLDIEPDPFPAVTAPMAKGVR